MRIKHLHLENIGPFIEADLEFIPEDNGKPPVTLITGKNGTGKSMILDAIRGMFGADYTLLDRDIRRYRALSEPQVAVTFDFRPHHPKLLQLKSSQILENQIIVKAKESLGEIPRLVMSGKLNGGAPNWVVDFWASFMAEGSYKVETLTNPKHEQFLLGSLKSRGNKADVTEFILYADYLRDSPDSNEKALGQELFALLAKIAEQCFLDDGKFSHVARLRLEPMMIQHDQPVNLAQLGSGTAYLLQSLLGLLRKLLAVHVLRQTPLKELRQTPGLLLIDEAENQLHPKWQKRLISNILDLFPNLQIIATTHSPFIISSVEDVRLFVCKAQGDHCVVVDETANYRNKPVDEILMSPLFEETQPFNRELSDLVKAHEQSILDGDEVEQERLEKELKKRNQEYFAYFELDKMIERIATRQENQ